MHVWAKRIRKCSKEKVAAQNYEPKAVPGWLPHIRHYPHIHLHPVCCLGWLRWLLLMALIVTCCNIPQPPTLSLIPVYIFIPLLSHLIASLHPNSCHPHTCPSLSLSWSGHFTFDFLILVILPNPNPTSTSGCGCGSGSGHVVDRPSLPTSSIFPCTRPFVALIVVSGYMEFQLISKCMYNAGSLLCFHCSVCSAG